MNKNNITKLFMGLITLQQALAQDLAQRDQIAAKQAEVLSELNQLKMKAFDIPGFSTSDETLSVDQIMDRSKELIQESEELQQQLDAIDLYNAQVQNESVPVSESLVIGEEPVVVEEVQPVEEIQSQEEIPVVEDTTVSEPQADEFVLPEATQDSLETPQVEEVFVEEASQELPLTENTEEIQEITEVVPEIIEPSSAEIQEEPLSITQDSYETEVLPEEIVVTEDSQTAPQDENLEVVEVAAEVTETVPEVETQVEDIVVEAPIETVEETQEVVEVIETQSDQPLEVSQDNQPEEIIEQPENIETGLVDEYFQELEHTIEDDENEALQEASIEQEQEPIEVVESSIVNNIPQEDRNKEQQSSGFFTLVKNLTMFGGFVAGAYYWNQSQSGNELKYDYKQASQSSMTYGKPTEMEKMYSSWSRDPNIGNRARSQGLMDLGGDDEISIQ